MAFATLVQARLPLVPGHPGKMTTLQASLHAADRPVAPPRFDASLSTDAGSFATGDLGVSPDRTHTGRLPQACARSTHVIRMLLLPTRRPSYWTHTSTFEESERRESNPRSQLGKSTSANFATCGLLQKGALTCAFASGRCRRVLANSASFAHGSRTPGLIQAYQAPSRAFAARALPVTTRPVGRRTMEAWLFPTIKTRDPTPSPTWSRWLHKLQRTPRLGHSLKKSRRRSPTARFGTSWLSRKTFGRSSRGTLAEPTGAMERPL